MVATAKNLDKLGYRVGYIDVAKLIGILLVIADHSDNIFKTPAVRAIAAKPWFCSFHMPLFFVLYGLVATFKPWRNRQDVIDWTWKRYCSMLVPYILWSLIDASTINKSLLLSVLWGTNGSLEAGGTNSILWFLPAMFSAALVSQLCVTASQAFCENADSFLRRDILLIVMQLIVGGLLGKLSETLFQTCGIPFGFDIGCVGAAFITAGRVVRPLVSKLEKKKYPTQALVALVCFSITFPLTSVNLPVGQKVLVMATAKYGRSLFLYFSSAVISSVGVASLSMVFEKAHLLAWLGRGSLVMMASHQRVLSYFAKWCANTFPGEPAPTLAMISVLVCALVLVPIVCLCRGFLPVLNGECFKEHQPTDF
ncbi:MAG: acyltransferase family protein [Atopobiaceae bacterium]|jgi:fucose 4-O-acetylase-like acetyltransferase|nr:acyltransferase family protein [Atopobiaceae bacterium]